MKPTQIWCTLQADIKRLQEVDSSRRSLVRGLLSQGFFSPFFLSDFFVGSMNGIFPLNPFVSWLSASLKITTGISIPAQAQIGKGLRIHHFGGIIIHSEVVIGEDCTLYQGVTLGDLGGCSGVPCVGKPCVHRGGGKNSLGTLRLKIMLALVRMLLF